jgi:hypothetical protein
MPPYMRRCNTNSFPGPTWLKNGECWSTFAKWAAGRVGDASLGKKEGEEAGHSCFERLDVGQGPGELWQGGMEHELHKGIPLFCQEMRLYGSAPGASGARGTQTAVQQQSNMVCVLNKRHNRQLFRLRCARAVRRGGQSRQTTPRQHPHHGPGQSNTQKQQTHPLRNSDPDPFTS